MTHALLPGVKTMLKAIRGMTVALALLAASGNAQAAHAAGGPSIPGMERTMARAALTFSSTKSYDTEQPESATGGAGSISFQGSIQTANPCYDVTAAQRQRGSRIVVTVTAAPADGICTQVITYNNYTGQVSGLAPGTYDFQLVEVAGGRSTTVLTRQVTVS